MAKGTVRERKWISGGQERTAFQATWRGPGGARRSAQFPTRAEAQAELEAALCPERHNKDITIWDRGSPHLGIRVGRSGRASWVVRYTLDGAKIRRSIGDCRLFDENQALERANEIVRLAKDGLDWFIERHRDKMRSRFNEYLSQPDRQNLKSFKEIKRYLEVVWAPIHTYNAETLHRSTIDAALERIELQRGAPTANRARAWLQHVFEWLLSTGRVQREGNPAKYAIRFKERKHKIPQAAAQAALRELGIAAGRSVAADVVHELLTERE